MKFKITPFLFVHKIKSDLVKTLHEQWFKRYSKENPTIPFVVKKSMNSVIAYFLTRKDTVVRFFFDEKGNRIGWSLIRTVDKEISDKMRFGFLIYTYLYKEHHNMYNEIDLFNKANKVYVIFKNKLITKAYGKRLVYFPFWWVLARESFFDVKK